MNADMAHTRPPRGVMIVEDSAVVRALLTHIVHGDPRLAMTAAVATAEEAIALLPTVKPDVISMDINLPGMDGLAATREIMATQPTPIVVISASIDRNQVQPTMDALRAGALSVVEKPVGLNHGDYATVAQEVCTQLAIMSDVRVVRHRMRGPSEPRPARRPRQRSRMLLCAASTGGPQALSRLFQNLPRDLSVPILLVQHMGASFMEGFADWLRTVVPQPVVLASAGMQPVAGTIHVAPGDRHLLVRGDGTIGIADTPPVGGQRPAATRLIETAADSLSGAATAVILTGMGEDGAVGVRRLIEMGGSAVAEDASSAIVNGMPAAAAAMGALTLPLDLIPAHLRRLFDGSFAQ